MSYDIFKVGFLFALSWIVILKNIINEGDKCMKGINNLKTGTKIITGFIFVAAITAVVGIVGMLVTQKVDGNLEVLYNERLIPNAILGKIQLNQADARFEMGELLYKSQLAMLTVL